MTKALQSPRGHAALLKEIKKRVRTVQGAPRLPSTGSSLLYWSIGRNILDRQQAEGWATKITERLAKELGAEFPASKPLSRATSKIGALLLRRGREKELCDKRLHNCRRTPHEELSGSW